MINYSIVMRSVNANLLEINQAKSRINQAKQEGKNPNQKDLDLVKTEKQNAFAISQYTDVMTIEKFAKHITSHGSVYSRADNSREKASPKGANHIQSCSCYLEDYPVNHSNPSMPQRMTYYYIVG